MKGYVVSVLLGLGLFIAAVVGMLKVQGRLDYAGTRDIPILGAFFDPPELQEPVASKGRSPRVAGQSRRDAAEEGPRGSGIVLGAPRFAPGGLFDFPRSDSGLSVDDINALLLSARDRVANAERRVSVIEQRETELLARERDLEDRESAIAAKLMEVDRERAAVDRRIKSFERDVVLVRRSDLPDLRDYARLIAAFRPEKAASFLATECATEDGKRRVVKALAVMDPRTAAEILAQLENETIRDLLIERVKVVKEPR